MLAGVLVESHRFDEAEAVVDTARELADDDDTLSQVLWRTAWARILAESGRADEAIAVVDRAVEIAKGKGAKRAMLLPVSAPFHCRLMQPAADAMAKALADGIKSKPPLRRLTVQPTTPRESPEGNPRMGWAGVIQELQKSPLLRERHASIEMAMSRPSP